MNIAGLQKMTLLDFPGKVACTVFLQGCNFRCPFCHNSDLLPGQGEPLMTDEELLRFLEKRTGLLDGVCITGGEPTLQPQLMELMRRINALNIGPAGLGGSTTALGVHVEWFPTHIAGLPVAVNICCHAYRHGSVTL